VDLSVSDPTKKKAGTSMKNPLASDEREGGGAGEIPGLRPADLGVMESLVRSR